MSQPIGFSENDLSNMIAICEASIMVGDVVSKLFATDELIERVIKNRAAAASIQSKCVSILSGIASQRGQKDSEPVAPPAEPALKE